MKARIPYVSPKFHPRDIADRYAATRDGIEYRIYEVNSKRETIRELIIDRADLPGGIADECDKWKSQVYNQVRMK